jgi:hypothetical protein
VGAALFFASFLLLPLWRGTGLRTTRKKWCRIGIALVCGYLVLAAGMHQMALARVRQFAADSRLEPLDIAALPLPPSVARWAGVIATPRGTYRVQFDQLGSEPVTIQVFSDPEPNDYIARARALHDVQIFLWFARFPVFHYLERENQHVVQISDLRFYGLIRRVSAQFETPPSAFTYEVVFGRDGHVLSSRLLE